MSRVSIDTHQACLLSAMLGQISDPLPNQRAAVNALATAVKGALHTEYEIRNSADEDGEGFDDVCDDHEAASRVGAKIIEAADRVKVAHAALPGSQAVWNFEIENTRFEVTVKVANRSE